MATRIRSNWRRIAGSVHPATRMNGFSIPVVSAIKAVEWAASELGHPLLPVGPLNRYSAPKRGSKGRLIGRTGSVVLACIGVISLAAVGIAVFGAADPANRAAITRVWNGLF